jgi:hypothetical protein
MEENNTKPDVEKIIAEIKDAVGSEDIQVDSTTVAAADRDSDLGDLLAEANHLLATQHPHRGFRGLLHKIARKALEPEFSDTVRFNALCIKILNKLNAIISGNDTETQSDFAAQLRRRIDLLTALGTRLDKYDQLKIDERLQKIEKRLDDNRD